MDTEESGLGHNVPITLDFEDIGVSIGEREILQHVNGKVKPGQMLAIMGPSGSGKTTLLNILAGRMQKDTGKVLINGKHINKKLKKRIGYVMQEDIFFSHLTLKETLTYSAMLRLPDTLSKPEKLKKVDDIVEILDLSKCLNTCIGSPLERGLSGGEKKRANIGCELITNPSLIFLDEPTSGLDSSNALNLINMLQDYCTRENKTIVTSIHQPSSQIFHMFDKLLLLCNGQVAFYGKAAQVLDFFESINLICEPHFNPADFILEKVTSGSENEDLIVESWAKKAKRHKEVMASRKLSRSVGQTPHPESIPNDAFNSSINTTADLPTSNSVAIPIIDGNEDVDPSLHVTSTPAEKNTKESLNENSDLINNSMNDSEGTKCEELKDYAFKESSEVRDSKDDTSIGTSSVENLPESLVQESKTTMSKDTPAVLSHENLSFEEDSEAELVEDKTALSLSDVGSDTELVSKHSSHGLSSGSESGPDVSKKTEISWLHTPNSAAGETNGDIASRNSGNSRSSKKKHHHSHHSPKPSKTGLPLVSYKPNSPTDVHLDMHDDDEDDEDYTDVHTGWVTSFWTQFTVLTERTFKQSKPEILSKLNFIQTFLLAVICGLIWFRIPYTEETIRDRYAMIFFVVVYWNFNPMFAALIAFPSERTVINKERAAGYYRLSAYYFAKLFSELPLVVCQPIGFLLVAYWMCGLNESVAFLGFLFVLLLTSVTAQSIGLFISATIMDFKKCIVVAAVFGLSTMLLGGFYQQHIPWWLKWFEKVSYLTYSFEACMIVEFTNSKPFRCSELSSYASCRANGTWITGEEVLRHVGVTTTLGENVAFLLPFALVFRALAYVSLRFLHKPK